MIQVHCPTVLVSVFCLAFVFGAAWDLQEERSKPKKNPKVHLVASLEGADLFQAYCANCHGSTATAVLNPAASVSLARYLIAPFLTAAAIAVVGSLKGEQSESRMTLPSNPLQFTSALQMAVLFQLVIFGVRWAEGKFGQPGVFVSAGLLGFTDVDALVISIAKNAAAQLSPSTIAQAITIGVLANTILKLGIAVVVGVGRFRSVVGAGLCAVAVACAFSIWAALM